MSEMNFGGEIKNNSETTRQVEIKLEPWVQGMDIARKLKEGAVTLESAGDRRIAPIKDVAVDMEEEGKIKIKITFDLPEEGEWKVVGVADKNGDSLGEASEID